MGRNDREIEKDISTDRLSKFVFVVATALMGIGVTAVLSAGFYAGQRLYSDPFFFFKRQMFWLAVAFVFLFIGWKIPTLLYRKHIKKLVLFSVVLLILPLIPGIGKHHAGASRWISLGRGITFSPTEFAKFSLIVYLAHILAKRREEGSIKDFVRGFLFPMIMVTVILSLIVLESDFSTSALLFVVALTMFFVSGVDVKHIAVLGLAGLIAGSVMVLNVSYRKSRVEAFLNPWADPEGKGYHLVQSVKAFENGGWFGVGIGQGVRKKYIPEAHTDFIFAVIGEETGFVGAFALVLIYFLFFTKGIKLSLFAPDDFSKLLSFGIVILISIWAFVNMAVVLGLVPTTGMVLPFLSYGGSSLVFSAFEVGVLLKAVRKDS